MFKWHGTENPPSAVTIDETCVAESQTQRQGSYYPAGDVDNGLSDPPLAPHRYQVGQIYHNDRWAGLNSDYTTKHHYTTIQAPGASFTRTLSPSATWLVPTPPVATLQGTAKVHYSATVLPFVDVRKIEFTNSHGVLVNHTSDFAGTSGGKYPFGGWLWPAGTGKTAVSYPISISRLIDATGSETDDANLLVPDVKITYDWGHPSRTYFVGYEAAGTCSYSFRGPGQTASGTGIELPLSAFMSSGSWQDQVLAVGPYTYGGSWRACSSDSVDPPVDVTEPISPEAGFFVTIGPPLAGGAREDFDPLNTPTLKRMNWVCTKAKGAKTRRECADKIWHAVQDESYFCGEDDAPPLKKYIDWELLDKRHSGECIEQATLMMKAMQMLGVGATYELIRASTDANVLAWQGPATYIDGHPAWLIMDFNCSTEGGEEHDWNAFEAACSTANRHYTIYPDATGDTALDVYLALTDQFTQFWVVTEGDYEPGKVGVVWVVVDCAPTNTPNYAP